ncbi:asparagine synthetase B family protein [Sphingomonas sp. ERG5]|uniref:asparagine synthetase B family protein n=1 Tax=Sphingomonas sp. ERG5 TaxID=1381597 RepID=UPI0009DDAD26|nr:asparagine synthase-related protein [Sphingomonas sp. ERG5]
MSAIAGVVFADGRAVEDALLARIVGASARRGFDGVTRWHGGPAGLIRFAHATTVEAVGEVQPFVSRRSDAVMVFDGRIDNRAELIALLGPSDSPPASAPDGEIALALFDRLGDDFVQRLAGDYAIAIWQQQHRRLLLLRSPFGWRPLIWTFDGHRFGFATEPRGLVLGLGIERRLNEGAIGEFLAARFVTETDTFWHGVHRLPQGGALAFEGGRVRQWAWHGGPFEDLSQLSLDEHVERFRTLFDQSLIAAARGSGPVTSQLSGGLDSSSVVCRMAELHRDGRIDRPVGAISARFPGEPHDETVWSQAVETHAGITAETVGSQPFDRDTARQWCADSYQLPLRPNTLDTTVPVCRQLRQDGRRILLTGEGGDDWLNGSFAHWPDLLARGQWRALFRHGAEQWPDAPAHVIARRTLYPALMPLISARHREALLQPHLDFRLDPPDWIRPDWMARIGLEARWRDGIARQGLRGFTQRSRYAVFTHARRHIGYEPVFAYAESQGIETRHPFHDLRLADFFMGASGSLLRKHNCRKFLLREAMRGTLPELVRTRTTKAYFVGHIVDAVDGLFEQRAPRDLLPATLGWIDPDRIAALHAPFSKWRRDGSTGPIPETQWGPVWFALAMDMWLENAFGL